MKKCIFFQAFKYFLLSYLILYLIVIFFAKLGLLNKYRPEPPISWEKLYKLSPEIMLIALIGAIVVTISNWSEYKK